MLQKPAEGEHNSYFKTYVDMVSEGNLFELLEEQMQDTCSILRSISETQGHFRYAKNKWSIKEVIGHITDTERIMGYRLLCIARGETISLPGFNENEYVLAAKFNQQSMANLINQLSVVRQSTLALVRSLDQEAWLRRGVANGSEVTARAIVWIIAGHELHHCKIIKERYLGSNMFSST